MQNCTNEHCKFVQTIGDGKVGRAQSEWGRESYNTKLKG